MPLKNVSDRASEGQRGPLPSETEIVDVDGMVLPSPPHDSPDGSASFASAHRPSPQVPQVPNVLRVPNVPVALVRDQEVAHRTSVETHVAVDNDSLWSRRTPRSDANESTPGSCSDAWDATEPSDRWVGANNRSEAEETARWRAKVGLVDVITQTPAPQRFAENAEQTLHAQYRRTRSEEYPDGSRRGMWSVTRSRDESRPNLRSLLDKLRSDWRLPPPMTSVAMGVEVSVGPETRGLQDLDSQDMVQPGIRFHDLTCQEGKDTRRQPRQLRGRVTLLERKPKRHRRAADSDTLDLWLETVSKPELCGALRDALQMVSELLPKDTCSEETQTDGPGQGLGSRTTLASSTTSMPTTVSQSNHSSRSSKGGSGLTIARVSADHVEVVSAGSESQDVRISSLSSSESTAVRDVTAEYESTPAAICAEDVTPLALVRASLATGTVVPSDGAEGSLALVRASPVVASAESRAAVAVHASTPAEIGAEDNHLAFVRALQAANSVVSSDRAATAAAVGAEESRLALVRAYPLANNVPAAGNVLSLDNAPTPAVVGDKESLLAQMPESPTARSEFAAESIVPSDHASNPVPISAEGVLALLRALAIAKMEPSVERVIPAADQADTPIPEEIQLKESLLSKSLAAPVVEKSSNLSTPPPPAALSVDSAELDRKLSSESISPEETRVIALGIVMRRLVDVLNYTFQDRPETPRRARLEVELERRVLKLLDKDSGPHARAECPEFVFTVQRFAKLTSYWMESNLLQAEQAVRSAR